MSSPGQTPPYVRRIVCLANSKKIGGRCVAGLELRGSELAGWIRPVGDRPKEQLLLSEIAYRDGEDPKLLDVIDVPLLKYRPQGCQTENHIVYAAARWVKVSRFSASELMPRVVANGPLMLAGDSSGSGENDRVSPVVSNTLGGSLELVAPEGLQIEVRRGFGKIKVRANFHLGSTLYNLGITDPTVEGPYRQQADGMYTYPRATVACISLSEPLNDGNRYKLVASLIDV